MSAKYSIDKTTKSLFFTGSPQSLNKDSICSDDKNAFTSVVIPNSVSAICDSTFYDCNALESAYLPNSVSIIYYTGFYACANLTSVHIPNSVETIGALAFPNCFNLTSIHIPNSVSTIGEWAFQNCPSLHKACVPINSKIKDDSFEQGFQPETSLLRPRLKHITSLQKKAACRVSKTNCPVYL